MFKLFLKLLLLSALILQVSPVKAQDSSTDLPTYIVQPGDSLNSIAYKLGVSAVDLADANSIQDPDKLAAGQILVIPGLNGIHGLLTSTTVPLGKTLLSLSRQYQMPVDTLVRLNHLTSPAELYAGATLFITQPSKEKAFNSDFTLSTGQSLLEAAVVNNVSQWSILNENQLSKTTDVIPGDQLFYSDKEVTEQTTDLLPSVADISIQPLPIIQGRTTQIKITSREPVTLGGSLGSRNLNFFKTNENEYVALQGIYGMADPGLYPIVLTTTLADGSVYSIDQMILIKPGYYPKDSPMAVDPITIDPKVTKPEDDQVAEIVKPVTPEKLWNGKFKYPVDEACINDGFGNRRSYNGSAYLYFHTGLDFGVCANNLNIYAPAVGIVVYTGLLTVRGNTTIIDHGWGIYSGLYHQKEIRVKVGDHVEAGQLIGIIGATGRVTGPHLHWDLFVNGIQVNGLDWLNTAFPVLK